MLIFASLSVLRWLRTGTGFGLMTLVICLLSTGRVFAAPTITRQPVDAIVTSGQNATFTVAATGTGTFTYQWQRNGIDISGATSSTFVLGSVTRGESGFYDVVVADGTGIAASSVVTLSVAPRSYPTAIAPDLASNVSLETDLIPMIATLAGTPDGGFYAGGWFSRVDGAARSCVMRINADGSLNASFVPPDFVGSGIAAVAVQPDGRVIVGGSFTRAGYYLRNCLVRLNADGTVDPAFNPPMLGLTKVSAVLVQPDGKILVGAGTSLMRLNSNGSLDRQMVPQLTGTPIFPGANPLSGSIGGMALQSDGKLIVVGSISANVAEAVYAGAIRVNTDGTVDTTFQFPTYNGVLHAAAVAHDGHVYVAGSIFFGSAGNSLLRLTSTGAIDSTFAGTTDGSLYAVREQADGRVIVGGAFTKANGVGRQDLARFNADGSLDSFVNAWPSSTVYALLTLAAGDVVTGSESPGPSAVRQSLARFSGTGVLQPTPNFGLRASGSPSAVAPLPGGKFLVFGRTDYAGSAQTKDVLRLNNDGTIDSSFSGNTNPSNSPLYSSVFDAASLPDGRMAIVGPFYSGPGPAAGVRLVRTDGSLDPSFTPATTSIGTGRSVAILPNGKIAVGGAVGLMVNLAYPGGVVVFNRDGTIDATFATGTPFDHEVLTIAAQADGRVLAGGNFTTFNGTSVSALVRLNANGTLDPTFNFSKAAKSVTQLRVLPSGLILAVTDLGIMRLKSDGTTDGSFQPAVSKVTGMLPQEDGKVIVCESPTIPNDLKIPVRLNVDGSLDASFRPLAVTPTTSGSKPLAFFRDDGQLLYIDGGSTGRLLSTASAAVPALTATPQAQTISIGGDASLTVAATSTLPVAYQWALNGTPIIGATSATYTVHGFQGTNAGTYTVTVTNDLGSVTSPGAALIAPGDSRGHLVNFSIRATAGTGDSRLIVGVVLGGEATGGPKPLLFRGVGPTLAKFGVPGVLPDPMLELYNNAGTLIDQNDDWTGVFDFARVGAFGFDGTPPKDAAIYNPNANNGPQTMHVIGKNGASGAALAEVYDATPTGGFTMTTPRFINGSARTFVGSGDNVLILGFVVTGQTSERVLIRAVGPTLGAAPFNVGGVLADTKLEIYDTTTKVKIAENDNWGDNGASVQMTAAFNATGAFGLSSPTSKDSAVVVNLPPGNYSAVIRGVGDTTGVALVELYAMP